MQSYGSLKLKKTIQFFRSKFAPSLIDIAFANWVKDDGDNLLRYKYNLNPNSVVFDVGSYKGDFASEIFARFQSQVFLFEPVEKFYNYSRNRFSKNSSIHIFQYGLGAKNETLQVQEDEIRTQMKKSEKGQIIEVKIRDIQEVLRELNITHIDLLKINIEGGEYELLEKFYRIGFLKEVTNIQIQFHDFVQDAERRKKDITKMLTETHQCTWCYPYIWENWTIKENHEAR